jgi:Na+:H+ antiporter, NhaA family
LSKSPEGRSWASSERNIPRLVVRPLREFLDTESAGGTVLLAATVTALVWANSPWHAAYEALWSTQLGVRLGRFGFSADLLHWVNEGAMTLFFFVVGLEIKRELVSGEMAGLRRAALPVAGAVGGMALPALIYTGFNLGGEGAAGWGIPMATDIAFAVGALALIAPRAPAALRIFLLTLAIVDDIGSIAIIALFYSHGLSPMALAVAASLLVVITSMKALRVWWVPVYVFLGTAFWFSVLLSGVNATIAGVVLAFMTPARALNPSSVRRGHLISGGSVFEPRPSEVRHAARRLHESVPVAERLEHVLHPWSGYLVIPLFALANAGLAIDGALLADALVSPVGLGVLAARVAGKLAGIILALRVAVRLGAVPLSSDVSPRALMGAAALCGVGFTVPLFVTGLAFDTRPQLAAHATVSLLVASLVAAVVGTAILRWKPSLPERANPAEH